MKIYYFDLGMHKEAEEIDLFKNLCMVNGIDYMIYGFEAHPEYCEALKRKYARDKNISIINKAISNKNGRERLYINKSMGGQGNSIFPTKSNVDKNTYIEVNSVLFSDWLCVNVGDLKTSNNILRFNIEGAEWHLFNDLADSGLIDYFKIILGSHPDMRKVSELKDKIDDYNNILEKHSIKVHRFVGHKPSKNENLLTLIKERF